MDVKTTIKKTVREIKVCFSSLLILHLYPNVETLYLSYFVVTTLMNYTPLFICNGLKCRHLAMYLHPPLTPPQD